METQFQNHQQNDVITRSEMNYLRATDALTSLNLKLEATNTELKKTIAEQEAKLNSQLSTITSQSNEIGRLRRELDNKNDIITDNKYELAQVKAVANRVNELERQATFQMRRHETEIDFKNLAIERKDNEIKELKETIEALEEEIELLENPDENNDEENEELEEGGTIKNEYGGLLNDVSEDMKFQMPESDEYFEDRDAYVTRKKEAILRLVDGGEISFNMISRLEEAKKNLGGHLGNEPVLTEQQKTEKAILDSIEKNGGRIPEQELISIKGVTLNKDGFVVLAKYGELQLRRSFLHPSFILIPKKS